MLNARLELPGGGAPKTKEDSEPANCISERVPYGSKLRTVKKKYRKMIGSETMAQIMARSQHIESHLIEENKVTGSESRDLY